MVRFRTLMIPTAYGPGAKRFISPCEMPPADFTGFSASSQRKTQWPQNRPRLRRSRRTSRDSAARDSELPEWGRVRMRGRPLHHAHSPSGDGRPSGRPMARRETGVLPDALWRGPTCPGSHCQAAFFALYPTRAHVGPVAQWLEPAAHNGLVAGSSPARPTTRAFDRAHFPAPVIWPTSRGVIRDSADQITRRFRQRRRRRLEKRIDNFLTGLLGHDIVFQNYIAN